MAEDGGGDGPERTPDGRHVVVDGRRWRATDPSIPEKLAAELRSALMAARRDVGTAKRQGDERGEREARTRVHAAKVALGERGRAWWEPREASADRARIEATTRALAAGRHPGTTCPSDVARAVFGEGWRAHMDDVRSVVEVLVAGGEVEVTQRGEVVDPPWRGPIRIRARVVDDETRT